MTQGIKCMSCKPQGSSQIPEKMDMVMRGGRGDRQILGDTLANLADL